MARQKILIIKLSALGDVSIAVPHIHTILEQHHDAVASLITTRPFLPLFSAHPRLTPRLLVRHSCRQGTWATLRWIRHQRFAVIYDLQGNRTSRLLTRWSTAPKRVGTQPLTSVYTHYPTIPYTKESSSNARQRLNETLVAAGLPPAPLSAPLDTATADQEMVADWLAERHLRPASCVLFHGSSSAVWQSKQWPLNHFRQLAELLAKRDLTVIWIGTPTDHRDYIALANSTGINGVGAFSLPQLYLLAAQCRFAITNDSGPMHLLAMANLPVYSFFGPTSWQRSHAAGQKKRVLTRNLPCSPCYQKRCPPVHGHRCLREITPSMVVERIAKDGLL